MPLILAVRGRWVSELEVSLVYRVEFLDSQDYMQRNSFSKNMTNKTKQANKQKVHHVIAEDLSSSPAPI